MLGSGLEADEDLARQADETEVAMRPLIAKEFGEDAVLSRDCRMGEDGGENDEKDCTEWCFRIADDVRI